METVYTVRIRGRNVWSGADLETAIRTWDRLTYAEGITPGGIEVRTFDGATQVRNGSILHVSEDGTVYLNPTIAQEG